jgi:hypothetical protein
MMTITRRDPIDQLADLFIERLCDVVALRLQQIAERSDGVNWEEKTQDVAGAAAHLEGLSDEDIEALADEIVGELTREQVSDEIPLSQIAI